MVVLQDETGTIAAGSLWGMAAVNWAIAIVGIVLTAKVLGQQKLERRTPTPSPLANMYAEAD